MRHPANSVDVRDRTSGLHRGALRSCVVLVLAIGTGFAGRPVLAQTTPLKVCATVPDLAALTREREARGDFAVVLGIEQHERLALGDAAPSAESGSRMEGTRIRAS